MSEAPSRPARGRSSARGGRASYGSRGPRKTNGDGASSNMDTSADQGELGELKKRYQSQLSTLKELFPDWTDADLVLAIEESDGDLQTTIEKISEGAVSQFSEVPKKAKDRSRSKAKENVPLDGASSLRGRPDGARRGVDSGRGGRGGRGTDRGRGGIRGGRGGAAGGPRTAAGSVPTTESAAWDTPTVPEESKETKETKHDDETVHAPEATPEVIKPVVEAGLTAAKKTWASMFAAPKPVPAVPKAAPKPGNPAAPEVPPHVPDETPAHQVAQEPAVQAEEPPTPPVADEAVETPPITAEDTSKMTPDKVVDDAAPDVTLTPSGDQLTQENVEHLPDESHPPPTETAFSTVASSKDIGSAVATPLNGPTHAPIGRPAIGGFQTTALKATAGTPHRSASYQRKLMEQQEAVVMPGNHAVDRAAVQFGSMGLGEGSDLDVDEDREEAETRTQPPQHSPVAQPRASLPPAPRQASQDAPQQESAPTPKSAPGLPPVPQHQPNLQQSPSSNPLASQAMQNQGSQSNQPYNQFAGYGRPGIHSEASAPPQKPYDPFGQQIPQSNQSQSQNYDYPGQQSQAPSQPGAFSSAPDSYPSNYLTSEQRAQYQNYYGSYGQPVAQSQQEAGSAQQRTGSAFGSGPADSAYSQSQVPQSQSRYGDAQNSGHNTPNPAAMAGQQGHGTQGQHAQHGQHSAGYPYNHPYYGSPYYTNYMNQFGGYGQGGAGYGSFGKGMYGQPHHYGMSPQASFDQHSSSPANAGGFGASSLHDRGSGMGAGFGDYGRSASGASQNPSATAGAAAFGAIPDTFTRPGNFHQSSYGQQGSQGLNDDALKPSGDYKSGGPSPSALGAQPGRPGSANQGTPGQSGPQHSQQGYGNYPSHLGNSQYGGLGGLGHQNSGSHQQQQQQQQQQSGYGNYGGFGGYGGGSYNRGGWGGNYGQH